MTEDTQEINTEIENRITTEVMRSEIEDSRNQPVVIRTLVVTNQGILDLYNWALSNMITEGVSSVEGILIYMNEMLLRAIVKDIENSMTDLESTEEYARYLSKYNEIVEKYADRNYAGEIVYEKDPRHISDPTIAYLSPRGNLPSFQENYIEYTEELRKLGEDPEVQEILRAKHELSSKVYAARICCLRDLSIDLSVTKPAPAVLGILLGGVAEDLRSRVYQNLSEISKEVRDSMSAGTIK